MQLPGTSKLPPLVVTRIFDTDNEGLATREPLQIHVERTTNRDGGCKALEGSIDNIFKWAIEKDWTFNLPPIEAAKEPEVQSIRCKTELKAMLKHVVDDSIIVYAIAESESSDEEDTVMLNEDRMDDTESELENL